MREVINLKGSDVEKERRGRQREAFKWMRCTVVKVFVKP